MLKYLEYRRACDVMFGVFMVTWFLVRHVAYLAVVHSIWRDYLSIVTFGCFTASGEGPLPLPDGYGYLLTPFLDPRGLHCQTALTTGIFVFLLLFLQAILIVWFGMILGVAYRVLRGQGAEDSRSDDEEDDAEDAEAAFEAQTPQFIEVPAPLEEEVGVEDLELARSPRSRSSRRYRKGAGASSGVTLPHDRKELLGRIGCDKGS